MASAYMNEITSVGLDAESMQAMSFSDVSSLLRILSQGEKDEGRTYSSVSVFPIADGRELYIQPH